MTYQEAELWLQKMGGHLEREDWESGAVEYTVHLPDHGPRPYFLQDGCKDVEGAIAKSITEIRKDVDRSR